MSAVPGERLRVRVVTEGPFTPSVITRLLGAQALPVPKRKGVAAPFITIDGRVHRPTSDYLRREAAGGATVTTLRRKATPLVDFLRFLVNEKGFHPHEDFRDPIFLATEEEFADFYFSRVFPDDGTTQRSWKVTRTVMLALYDYCERVYHHHDRPFEVEIINTPRAGRVRRIRGYHARRTNIGSSGVPLTPQYADLLIMGALRVDLNGNQDAYSQADRDHAIISLPLACGVRRQNLAYVTHYEVPNVTAEDIGVTRVANMITKFGAGGDALTFNYRIVAVHDYINGQRADQVVGYQHRPDRPLQIVKANGYRFTYLDPNADDPTELHGMNWTDAGPEIRNRLIDPDGSSPILFLTDAGSPLTYSGLQHVVKGAKNFVRERIDPKFPAEFRLHDLRHTYAVHMVVAVYRGIVSESLRAHSATTADNWVVDHLTQAVDLVSFSLGHASKASTKLYLQTAHRFLSIPAYEFTGRAA